MDRQVMANAVSFARRTKSLFYVVTNYTASKGVDVRFWRTQLGAAASGTTEAPDREAGGFRVERVVEQVGSVHVTAGAVAVAVAAVIVVVLVLVLGLVDDRALGRQ